MKKSVLILDKPETCRGCPLLSERDECIMQNELDNIMADSLNELMENCPLEDVQEGGFIRLEDDE